MPYLIIFLTITKSPNVVSIYNTSQEAEDVYCDVCQNRFKKADKQYPCRVCDNIFHKSCILGIKNLHPSHNVTIERANTKVGWSCPACVGPFPRFSIFYSTRNREYIIIIVFLFNVGRFELVAL